MAKKKKKNAAGIFFLFFLKAIVIILGLVILAMGAYLVKYTLTADDRKQEQEFDESLLVDSDRDELLASDTDSSKPENENLLYDDSEGSKADLGADDKIVVLNATETSGLAAAWKDKLAEAGFTTIETGNYFGGSQDSTRIVYTEEISSSKIAELFPEATMETGTQDNIECDLDKDGVKVFIIIGNSDDIVSQ